MARKLPHPISKEDFDKILEYLKKERENHWKPRKKCYDRTGEKLQDIIIAMCLGFGAGMRISEIVGLEKKQRYQYTKKDGTKIDKIIVSKIPKLTYDRIENNFIRVISGKGRKDRTVPLPMKTFRRAGITRAELEKKLPLKLGYRSIEKHTTDLGTKVLKKHITFHQLRHGFITHALESGLDIHQVQMFAGHSRMDTTGLYLHANPKKALDRYEEVF